MLRVLSYNVHSQRDDLDALARVVREIKPDVAIIQEGPRRFRWRQKCAALGRSLDLFVAGGGLPSLGNLVLTNLRVRVVHSWSTRYPLTPGKHMRGAVFVRCSVGRVPFVVAGSHLSTDPTERPAQASLLKQWLVEIDEPVIFGADLNENSGGAAWRMLADGLLDTGAAAGRPATATFPSSAPRERIDVVLVDPRYQVRECRVVDSADARAASDHLPVVADLELAAP